MIRLSNGMGFSSRSDAERFVNGLGDLKGRLLQFISDNSPYGDGVRYAKSTAIAAIDAAIENAELALKSAQRKEEKMKACKKAVKPVAKKPAVKKPVAKKATGKKK